MKTIVMYHGGCQDGFTAAWVIKTFLMHDGVELVPFFWQSPYFDEDTFRGNDVIMVDCAYKDKDLILKTAEVCNRMAILDHHESTLNNLKGFEGPTNVEIVLRMDKCGAELAWDYCYGDMNLPPERMVDPPDLIRYVRDRDLWEHALPNTKEINNMIGLTPKTMSDWDFLSDCIENDTARLGMIHNGEAIEKFKEQAIYSHMKRAYKVPKMQTGEGSITKDTTVGIYVVNCSIPAITSELCHRLAFLTDKTFAMAYHNTPTGWRFELRSAKDGMDVSKVAERYCGGGHKHAAGFQMSIMPTNWMRPLA